MRILTLLAPRVFIWEDGSLEILNVTRADEGRYTCFAENDRGKANSTGSLLVLGEFKIEIEEPLKGHFCCVSVIFAVALTDVSFKRPTSLSVPGLPNRPDLQMSSVVELWPSEQSNSGRCSVTWQGQGQRSMLGIPKLKGTLKYGFLAPSTTEFLFFLFISAFGFK